jgi:adenylyltransferase/sulfurtransferase
MVFNGVTNQFYTTKLPFREDCLSHETYPEPVELELRNDSTVDELLKEAAKSLEGPLTLALERDLVTTIHCPRCETRTEIFRPRTKVGMSEAICPNCSEPGRPEIVNAVESGTALAHLTLAKLGIPPYDIVRVDGLEGSGFFLLTGDRAQSFGRS